MTQQQKHFSASELAGLPGMPTTKRRVNARASAEQWPCRPRAHNGGGREYPISCLPAATQAALAEKVLSAAPGALVPPPAAAGATSSSDAGAETLARLFDAKPESIKAEARSRLAIVREYHELVGRGFKPAAVIEAVTRDRQISEATLSRYLAAVRGEAEHLWVYALCPNYAGRAAQAIDAEAWEVLKGDYLRMPPPTAMACINRLREAARAKGWKLPSNRTLLRRLERLPRAVKELARRGRKAAMQLYPAQQRVKAALHALAIVNGDGYAHKRIWVAFEDGEIRRARTWFWQDVYSAKILAWRTDKTEHTDLIRLSFGDLIERFGIPGRAVLLDNTRAAANKTMSGGVRHRFRFKVKDEEPDGVFKLLGIERVMWATPDHGQAKPIERGFGIGGVGEYVDKAPEFTGAGDDSDQYDGRTRAIPISQLEEVIAREVAALNARDGRRGAMQQGRSFDAVFSESYARATIRRATDEQRRLWLLCTEPVKVHRDATITLDAGRMVGEHRANRYWNSALLDYAGRMVAARFDPARLHEGVHLYSVDGRYIGFGDCVDPAGFDDQTAARDHARDRKTFMRSTRVALDAERRMNARQAATTLQARNVGGAADSSIPAPKVVRAEFRDPLERPRFVPPERSAEERAELERFEAGLAAPAAVNVLELRSDADKHAYWKALDERRAAGEQLLDQELDFWTHWQTQDYFRIAREAEAEFERLLEARQASA